jgi:hypothetical protein
VTDRPERLRPEGRGPQNHDPLAGITCRTRTQEAPVDDLATARTQEYEKVFRELVAIAERLDTLKHVETGGVDPHVTAAMHALRFAATILWPTIPHVPPPGYRFDSGYLLELAANSREAALEIGEFAPARPALRLVTDTATPPS